MVSRFLLFFFCRRSSVLRYFMQIFKCVLYFFSYLGTCNIGMYYELKGLPALTSGPARRDNEASAFVEILFGFVDHSTASTIATLAYGYLRWNESPGGILSGPRRRLVVIVRRRSWTPIARRDARWFEALSGLFIATLSSRALCAV